MAKRDSTDAAAADGQPTPDLDLEHVRGQEGAKRALEIAAAGGHPILIAGPQSSGKTMLARALLGILPPPSEEERAEIAEVYRRADLKPPAGAPVRAPHFSTRPLALGGGRRPGVHHRTDEAIRGHVFCSFLALRLRSELENRLATRGESFEWENLLRDLDRIEEIEIEKQGARFLLRTEATGCAGKVFQAAGVALPPTLRKVS